MGASRRPTRGLPPAAAHERSARAAIAAGVRKRRNWDGRNPGNLAIREELAAAALAAARLDETTGEVLDAGCGTGWLLSRLTAAGVDPSRVHGVDLLPERVDAARSACPGARVARGDVTALDYADARFDAVFLVTVLSSLPDEGAVRGAVAEAWRVLAPGGRLVVWEPRVPTPLNRATRRVRRADLRAATGEEPATRSITVLPPLARRLPGGWYPALSRLRFLRTHRLYLLQRPRR